jgi:UDP-2,3-diacylglucosamine pyrophosphatase LpxH
MLLYKALDRLCRTAPELPFDDTSKLVIMSDAHRGDNTWADNFANNQNLFFHALQSYFYNGFTYVEAGDGDELWQNRSFADIRKAHSDIFWLLREFHQAGRLQMLWGNHDIVRQNPKVVHDTLYNYQDERTGTIKPLLDGVRLHEGLRLRYTPLQRDILVVHGHQGSLMYTRFWRLGRLLIRYFWRPLQIIGLKDPRRPSTNVRTRDRLEQEFVAWVQSRHHPLIAGHLHRAKFAEPGMPSYFNGGTAVHPRCITGLEIEAGKITLVKWCIEPNEHGALYVVRRELTRPRAIASIF